MRWILKILNPAIYLINVFMYLSYIGGPEIGPTPDEPYNFDNDLKYF
jgi:hypothetical protein